MKLQNLSYKILFSIFFFAVAGIIFFLKIGGKTQKVSAAWWNSNWHYRRSITLTNSSGAGRTNVLVKVLENYNLSSFVSTGKLQADLDDIRFTNSNDSAISYWIEDATNTSADIWAIIPSLPASGTTIWMYYGNSSATSSSTPPFTYSGTSQVVSGGNGQFQVKFLTSGTLTVTTTSTFDAFLVGGGGAGASRGGHGGGGYTTTTSVSLSQNQPYTITIGGGGATSTANGATTSAFSYTSNGGNGGVPGVIVGQTCLVQGTSGSAGNVYYYSSLSASAVSQGSGQMNKNLAYPITWATHNNGTSVIKGYPSGYYRCSIQSYGAYIGTSGSNGAGGSLTYAFGGSSGEQYSGTGTTLIAGSPNTGRGGGGSDSYNNTSFAVGGSGIVVIRHTSISTSNINVYEENNFTPSDDWNTNWRYRQTMTISNPCGIGQSNVTIKILNNYDLSNLINGGKLQSDLDDLRFADSNNYLISYWIEDSTSTSVDVWALMTSIPASGTTIYMYYGNSSASGVSSTTNLTIGGTMVSINDYRIHIFKQSATLVNVQTSTVELLLVGGGGGGGSSKYANGGGGGGGAGGLIYNSSYSLGSGSITVTVGGGGAAGTAGSDQFGSNGSNSVFQSLTATGGGGGANNQNYGRNGGSGGGGGYNYYSSVKYGGSGVAGIGNAGGNTSDLGSAAGAGGGGAGSVGGPNLGNHTGGVGGAGLSYSTTGNSVTYATGGNGGGQRTRVTKTANTGDGGDAAYSTETATSGASGIAVIRYRTCAVASSPLNETDFANPIAANICLVEESPADSQMIIKWQDNSSIEAGYYIQKSTDSGTWTNIFTSDPDITNYTDTSISQNHTYQYRIAPFTSITTTYNWCYTSVLNLGRGNFNFEGLNLEGVNLD